MARRSRVSVATIAVAACLLWSAGDDVRTQSAEPTYTVIDIGTLGGTTTARGAGEYVFEIVGSAGTATGATVPFTRSWYTGIHPLPTLGGANGDAYAASGGMVVGRSQLGNGRHHATLWESGTPRDMGTLGGAQSIAYAVNGWGVIVGTSDTAEAGATQAFTYEGLGSHVMTPLPVAFGGNRSIAYDINDAGRIVGTASLAGNAVSHAFLYANGAATDLGSPGGTSVARAINEADDIVGYWQSASGATTHAFLHRGGSFETLPGLGGADTRAIALDEGGAIVGTSRTAGGSQRAVLWRDGAVVDLNTRIPAGSGWVLQSAVAIDALGNIVGYGLRNGQRRGFVLVAPSDLRVQICCINDEDTNSPNPHRAGGTIRLGAMAVNDTGGWSTGIVITDRLSGPAEYVTYYSDWATCTQAGQTMTCQVDRALDPGTMGAWVFFDVRSTGPGVITHTASVSADQADPNPSNNSASQTNTAVSLAELTVATPVVGGRPALARATLTSPTPSGGARVRLSSSNPAVAQVPAEFDVLPWSGGGLWREFYVTTSPVGAVTDVQISATYGLVTKTQTLRVLPYAPTPYGGTAWSVPWQIEAEDYDVGGEGIAYHDTTSGNAGGRYRTDRVDIAATTDAGGGFNVGWIVAGEWLNYAISVATAADYVVQARVASLGAGGTFHVEGRNGTTTGPMAVPDTGGWQSWRTISAPLRLEAGNQSLRVVFDTNGASGAVTNLNWLRVVRSGAQPTPYGGSPMGLPGTVLAERFDYGGPAVAYHDTTRGNSGGAFRATQVDIAETAGGGFHVGWTRAGEWLAYTVNVPAAGTYTLAARVASNGSGGTFHVEFDGVDRTGPITVPNTGGWQQFTTVSRTMTLAAGTQIMRVVSDANGATGGIGNMNDFTIASGAAAATGASTANR